MNHMEAQGPPAGRPQIRPSSGPYLRIDVVVGNRRPRTPRVRRVIEGRLADGVTLCNGDVTLDAGVIDDLVERDRHVALTTAARTASIAIGKNGTHLCLIGTPDRPAIRVESRKISIGFPLQHLPVRDSRHMRCRARVSGSRVGSFPGCRLFGYSDLLLFRVQALGDNLRALIFVPISGRVGNAQHINAVIRRSGIATAVADEASGAEGTGRRIPCTAEYPRGGSPGIGVSLGIRELNSLRRARFMA